MKKWKNRLDERQEQAMLQIEHKGCWIAFWGLFIVIALEYIAFGYEDIRAVAGEWAVFMILALYLSIDCTRKGIFDRRLKPNAGTYVVSALIGGVVAGLILGIVQYRRFPEFAGIAAIIGAVSGVFTFILILVTIALQGEKIKNREKTLESQYDDEEA